MTATLTAPTRTQRLRFTDLIAAEWIKLVSQRSIVATLAIGTVAMIGAAVASSRQAASDWTSLPVRLRGTYSPTHAAFPLSVWLLLMVVAGTIGALVIVGEHASGLIRTTFTAVPARGPVVAAKAVVLAGVLSVVGVVVSIGSWFACRLVLSGLAVTWPADPVPAIAASALLVPVCALAGLGIGAVLRNTAVTVVATFVVLVLVPLALTGQSRWVVDLAGLLPFYGWSRLLMPSAIGANVVADGPGITVTHAWIVLAVWPVLATVVAAIVTHRRDV